MDMKHAILAGLLASALAGGVQAQDDIEMVLVPGLTTDAFYTTMNKGAQAAAAALGIKVDFQGAEDFNPTLQIPVLDGVIARQPDAILIAPTDTTQLIDPLARAHEQGSVIVTVDTFIDDGVYQNGAGDGDFPISYIASDNLAGGRMAAAAMAEAMGGTGSVYVSNVRPGISTTDQRGGVQGRDERALPRHHGARHPVQRERRLDRRLPVPGRARTRTRSRRRVRREPLLRARCGQRGGVGRQAR